MLKSIWRRWLAGDDAPLTTFQLVFYQQRNFFNAQNDLYLSLKLFLSLIQLDISWIHKNTGFLKENIVGVCVLTVWSVVFKWRVVVFVSEIGRWGQAPPHTTSCSSIHTSNQLDLSWQYGKKIREIFNCYIE